MTTTVYKIQKGKRTFYARIDVELKNGEYIGYQCYKDGEYVYSKWSSKKTLTFNKSEIINIFDVEVVE